MNAFEHSNVIKFVKSVENHECIWNNRIPEHNKRNEVNIAWKIIANEFNDPVRVVRDRWRSIRNTFLRSMKKIRKSGPSGNKIKEYYLAEHLQFLLPHIKHNFETETNSSSWGDQTEISSDDDIDSYTEIEVNHDDHDSIANFQMSLLQPSIVQDHHQQQTEQQQLQQQQLQHQIKQQQRQQIQRDQRPFISSQMNISPQMQQNFVASTSPLNDGVTRKRNRSDYNEEFELQSILRNKVMKQEDANFYFLKSLLPDLNSMDPIQNRRFRHKVVALMDNILNNTDIIDPQNQFINYAAATSTSQQHSVNLLNDVKDEIILNDF